MREKFLAMAFTVLFFLVIFFFVASIHGFFNRQPKSKNFVKTNKAPTPEDYKNLVIDIPKAETPAFTFSTGPARQFECVIKPKGATDHCILSVEKGATFVLDKTVVFSHMRPTKDADGFQAWTFIRLEKGSEISFSDGAE